MARRGGVGADAEGTVDRLGELAVLGRRDRSGEPEEKAVARFELGVRVRRVDHELQAVALRQRGDELDDLAAGAVVDVEGEEAAGLRRRVLLSPVLGEGADEERVEGVLVGDGGRVLEPGAVEGLSDQLTGMVARGDRHRGGEDHRGVSCRRDRP